MRVDILEEKKVANMVKELLDQEPLVITHRTPNDEELKDEKIKDNLR